jgi:hypothetical protein
LGLPRAVPAWACLDTMQCKLPSVSWVECCARAAGTGHQPPSATCVGLCCRLECCCLECCCCSDCHGRKKCLLLGLLQAVVVCFASASAYILISGGGTVVESFLQASPGRLPLPLSLPLSVLLCARTVCFYVLLCADTVCSHCHSAAVCSCVAQGQPGFDPACIIHTCFGTAGTAQHNHQGCHTASLFRFFVVVSLVLCCSCAEAPSLFTHAARTCGCAHRHCRPVTCGRQSQLQWQLSSYQGRAIHCFDPCCVLCPIPAMSARSARTSPCIAEKFEVQTRQTGRLAFCSQLHLCAIRVVFTHFSGEPACQVAFMKRLLPAGASGIQSYRRLATAPAWEPCQPVSVGVNVYCARLGVLLVWSRQVSVMGAFHAHAPTSSLLAALPRCCSLHATFASC